MENPVKIPQVYNCINCDYNTCSFKDYNKHLLTNKHISRTNLNNFEQKNPENPKEYKCNKCNKSYKARNSLWYHQQKCNQEPVKKLTELDKDELIITLLKQNADLIKGQQDMIIVKNLNNLDETERPIHCTDKKRETMYVKDEGEWNKEDEKKSKLKKAINKIADKNIRLLPQFREKYPDYNNSSSKFSDVHDKLVIEVMETDDNKKEKIIHNISKVTTIK